jgi:hypothetical protein
LTVSKGLEISPSYFKANSSFELITNGNDSGRKKEELVFKAKVLKADIILFVIRSNNKAQYVDFPYF